MTITEKVAYLKGLINGLGIDETTKEGKILTALVDTIDDIALTLADNSEQLNAVDEDLDLLENYVYDDEWDSEECDCGCCDEAEYEIECPSCHETVFIDEEALNSDEPIKCPACGTVLEGLTFDGDDE